MSDEKTIEMRLAEIEDKLARLHVTEEEMRAFHKVNALLGGGGGEGAGRPGRSAAGGGSLTGRVHDRASLHQPLPRHQPRALPNAMNAAVRPSSVGAARAAGSAGSGTMEERPAVASSGLHQAPNGTSARDAPSWAPRSQRGSTVIDVALAVVPFADVARPSIGAQSAQSRIGVAEGSPPGSFISTSTFAATSWRGSLIRISPTMLRRIRWSASGCLPTSCSATGSRPSTNMFRNVLSGVTAPDMVRRILRCSQRPWRNSSSIAPRR